MHGRTSRGNREISCLSANEFLDRPHREVSGHTPVMNEREKSDSLVVPKKPPNKAEEPAAEGVEGSELAKGMTLECNAFRTQGRGDAHSTLERTRRIARVGGRQRFTALLHHVYDVDRLRAAYHALKRDAAAGVDGETWQHYGRKLESNLQDLSRRLTRRAYRAKPVRRAYIPKADGRQRLLGVPALEDKIVQRAVVEVLCEPVGGDPVIRPALALRDDRRQEPERRHGQHLAQAR